MKKIFSLGLLTTFVLMGLVPMSLADPKARVIGGYSVTRGHWSDGLGVNELLSYDFETENLTKVEGRLAHPKTGLSLGVDVSMDNAIGRANSIKGYLGIRRLILRAAASNLKGTVNWDDTEQRVGFKQPKNASFDSKYNYVDLVYHTKKTDLFFGFGVTKFSLPTEIKAYSKGAKGGHYKRVGAYDPDYEVDLYNFVFGWDTMTSSVFFDSDLMGKPKDGLGMFFATEDRFGIGSASISPETMQVLRDNNPGFTATDATATYWMIENDTSLGLKWTKTRASGAQLAIGLGYELAFIFGDAFSGNSGSETELELQPHHGLVRHGPILRIYLRI